MTMMGITTMLTGLNLLLILGLVTVYGMTLKNACTMHTIGLLIFASLFLVQNAVALYFYLTMMPYFAAGLESYALVLAALQTIAFAIMNWITWR